MAEVQVTGVEGIAKFVDELLKKKGIVGLSNEEIAKVRRGMRVELDEMVERAVLGALSDEQMAQLDKMLDEDAEEEEVEKFLEGSKADFEKATQAEVEKFEAEFLKNGTVEMLMAKADAAKEKFEEEAPEWQGTPDGSPEVVGEPKMPNYHPKMKKVNEKGVSKEDGKDE